MSLEVSSILIMLFVTIYVAIINIFSILFRMTGLTKEKSKFQTITLFTAVGFTTSESEIITSDRTRRKIATACMITGNFFSVIIVSLIVNLISNFSVTAGQEVFLIIGIAMAVFVALFIVFQIPAVKRGVSTIIEAIAIKSFGKDKNENFLTLLDNYGENAIVEVCVNRLPRMLDGISIAKSGLKQVYGINLLMIKRKGHVLDVSADTMIQQNDNIVVFGKRNKINEVFLPKYGKLIDAEPISDNTIELLDNFSGEAMAKVTVNTVPMLLRNRRLSECKLKMTYGLNIVIVERGGKLIDVGANTVIKPKDEMIVFGPFANIRYLFTHEDASDVNVINVQSNEEDIYSNCPSPEDSEFLLRPVEPEDCERLLAVYGDETAAQRFNSDDSTSGSIFYSSKERMAQAVEYWKYSFGNKWGVWWSIIDKKSNCVVGTLDITRHLEADAFYNGCVVKLALHKDFENASTVKNLLKILLDGCMDKFDCDKIVFKCKDDWTERLAALKELGFEKSSEIYKGRRGESADYWVLQKK